MHSVGTSLILQLTSNTINCLSSAYVYSTNLQSKMTSTTPTYDLGGAFYITSAVSITSSSNTLSNCYLCDQGGAFSLYSTTLTDTGSKYVGNAALLGGVYYSDKSTVTLSGVTVQDSYAIYGGGW